MGEYSPMMSQYFKIKEQYEDSLLFFRLGDFYEMFFDDAITAARALDLVLTGRDCGQAERAPMCGVPFHSAENYIDRLVQQGYKVAICEQMEDPSQAKGIVRRDVIRVITAGTVTSENILENKQNNFLCAIYIGDGSAGIAFCDISTGETSATEVISSELTTDIINEIGRNLPSEILINKTDSLKSITNLISDRFSVTPEAVADFASDYTYALECVAAQFGDNPLGDNRNLTCAVGMLMDYIKKTQKRDMPHISSVNVYSDAQYMGMDYSTRRNLELTANMRENKKRGSLLWVLDKTSTSMGGRMLRSWINKPLLNCGQILNRQGAVADLFSSVIRRDEIKELLSPVQDIERIMAKVVTGSANPKDLLGLAASLKGLPEIKQVTAHSKSKYIQDLSEKIDTVDDVCSLIESAISESAPMVVREGNIINAGYNADVDKNRDAIENSSQWLAKLEMREKEETGIKNLKITYNKVFGYYIEVSKSNIALVPDRYTRKQTLTNCERYITGELKEFENSILGAKDRNCALEYELYCEVRDKIAQQNERILATARTIAELDCINSLAIVAAENNYVMPTVNMGDKIVIKDGRHPVVELIQKNALFVPNDTTLSEIDRVAIITGPNMAGKSTYMRQVALITLMAQIGSFIPASYAEIGVVDRIFTRVGATDDLALGQSTFMVEMTEVANILDNATSKSLLILDEIGRGTSTFDGMSIAWAVIEYVANKKKLGAKTLFATHYHELTELEGKLDGVKNYCIAVKKRGDEIIFLRKIILGGADDSYGIEVAGLAGVKKEVIKRAKEILHDIETDTEHSFAKGTMPTSTTPAMPLFENNYEEIIDILRNMDITTITPIEALNKLFELKNMTDAF
ncbi:MAG: DNA mismatch repair protein MutS [Eubacteriales bacterium]|nr:DNA mismatch repair protein MutS [Eubacteriales bacterium]